MIDTERMILEQIAMRLYREACEGGLPSKLWHALRHKERQEWRALADELLREPAP